MEATSQRWRQITPSQFQWEQAALEYVRSVLPDADPIQAWANFEFVSGGSINEVDLLVTTKKGVWLIEIKSHPNRITGDQSLWTWHRPDGGRSTFDNPLFLANAKAKRLRSMLRRHWPRGNRAAPDVPFINALVFLSDPSVTVELPADLSAHICVRDPVPEPSDPGSVRREGQGRRAGGGPFRGLRDTIHVIGAAEANNRRFHQLSVPEAEAFARAMGRIGIKVSTKSRKVGSYVLELPAFAERGDTQDFLARHEQHGTLRRVRVFSNIIGMSPEQAAALKDAATREFLATERLHIDGIVLALDQFDHELGVVVIYDHHPSAIRLDRFLAERGEELDLVAPLRVNLG